MSRRSPSKNLCSPRKGLIGTAARVIPTRPVGACLVCLFALAHVAKGQEGASKMQDLQTLSKAAITAYAANIHAFPFYTCRYRVTKAEAKSPEAAIARQFLNATSYECRESVDGDKHLYEGFGTPPDPRHKRPIAGQPGAYAVVHFGDSTRYLADGKRELSFFPPMATINLWRQEKHQRGVNFTPLSMMFIGDRQRGGPDVELAQPDKYEFQVRGLQEVRSCPVITVRFKYKDSFMLHGKKTFMTRDFSLDPAHGHLPAQMVLYFNDQIRDLVAVTDVRECSNGRWFPERSVQVITPDREGSLYDVHEIQLLELDADHRPKAGDFVHTFPAGTAVCEVDDMSKFFRLKQDEKISVDDLPNLFGMLERVAVEPYMDTAIPRPAWWQSWVLGLGGLVLALGGAFVLVRRWRLRHS